MGFQLELELSVGNRKPQMPGFCFWFFFFLMFGFFLFYDFIFKQSHHLTWGLNSEP